MHLSMQLRRLPEAEKNEIACLSPVYNFTISYLNPTMNPMKNAKCSVTKLGLNGYALLPEVAPLLQFFPWSQDGRDGWYVGKLHFCGEIWGVHLS